MQNLNLRLNYLLSIPTQRYKKLHETFVGVRTIPFLAESEGFEPPEAVNFNGFQVFV